MSLVVELSEELFRDKLDDRFNPENAVDEGKGVWYIRISCTLCDCYRSERGYCGYCPFREHAEDDDPGTFAGCFIWLRQVMDDLGETEMLFAIFPGYIAWNASDDTEARCQLGKLRDVVLEEKRYIKWT